MSLAIHWIHQRRPLLTAIVVLGAAAFALLSNAPPADLLSPEGSVRARAAWILMLVGVAARIWGAGNLRKNQEITETGIYAMVRHPLYLGSLCLFLAYFITVGDPWVGALLFAVLVAGIYYPTMLAEEANLAAAYPEESSRYQPPPRLFPDPRRLTRSLHSDRFDLTAARRNLGLRSLGFLVGLPIFLRLFAWVGEKL